MHLIVVYVTYFRIHMKLSTMLYLLVDPIVGQGCKLQSTCITTKSILSSYESVFCTQPSVSQATHLLNIISPFLRNLAWLGYRTQGLFFGAKK